MQFSEIPLDGVPADGHGMTPGYLDKRPYEGWITEMMRDDFTQDEFNRKCPKCVQTFVVRFTAKFCQACGTRFLNTDGVSEASTQTPAVWLTEGDAMPENICFTENGSSGSRLTSLVAFKNNFQVYPTLSFLNGPLMSQVTVCRVMISYWYKNLCQFCPWLNPYTSLLRCQTDARPGMESLDGVPSCLKDMPYLADDDLFVAHDV